MRARFQLHVMFSHVPSSKPLNQLLNECDEVLLLKSDGHWNPINGIFTRNEKNTLDCEGDAVE